MLLESLFYKNFPNIFIPNVFNVGDDSIAIIVLTHSNNTEFPLFLLLDVLVATYASISLISSLIV